LKSLALFIVLTVPITAHAHAELFFPKVFSPGELQTSGFVLLNPDPITASVNIYLISISGTPLASKGFTIPAGGQLAKVGSELFPEGAANGWVYVQTDTEGMQAFWLSYDTAITSLDGAEAAGYDTIGSDQVIPLVAGSTELNVINPNFLSFGITIRLYGERGELAPGVSRSLPAAGAIQSRVSDLFPSADLNDARYLRVNSNAATIATSAMIRGYLVANESAVINGVNISSRKELIFPHVINGSLGSANYTTILGVTNTSTIRQNVTLTFNSESGDSFSVTQLLEAGGSMRQAAQDLFGLSSVFQNGWVKVSGTNSITGFAAYADLIGGGLAIVPAGSAESRMFLSHIANGAPNWQTGIALLNVNGTAAHVEVYAVNPSGSLIGGASTDATASFTLEPGKKIAKVVHEVIPGTQGVNGGFVFVTSDTPVFGLELFYTRDLKVLSNVAAGRLVIAYRPPTP
jgi:hypothetical protein